MGPEVPSRARRPLPVLHRSENKDGRRPSECSRLTKSCIAINIAKLISEMYHWVGFLKDENIRMAYGHPRSRSCGGLEGPFGPC